MDLSLERAYRTSTHRIGRDFYARLLTEAARYRRAAGYFSSNVFGVAPDAHLDYFARGGTIQLVCSDVLARSDIEALTRAIFDRPRVRSRFTAESLDAQKLGRSVSWPEFVSWLVASDLVEIRIARLEVGGPTNLYHEKLGVFYDTTGNIVAFTGSANETEPGYVSNFERIDVFPSFGGDAERKRARAIEQHFLALWNNETPGVQVLSLYDALRQRLVKDRGGDREVDDLNRSTSESQAARIAPETLFPAHGVTLHRHQHEAIAAWSGNGGKGILEMATGSGKTITALTLASRLYDRIGAGFVVLIVAPLVHLVDQWIEVAGQFGLNPVRCAEGSGLWYQELSTAVQAVNAGQRPVLSVATTSATLAGEPLQRLIGLVRRPVLLIADEVHTYGSNANFRALPRADVYRVGLSATPERWMDTDGTSRLISYFGSVVYRYTLADALRDEVLTPYRYYPELLPFDDEEMDRYLGLTRQIIRLLGDDEHGPIDEAARRLLIRRARLVGSARSKLPHLRHLLKPRARDTHVLVYCGDGTTEGPDGDETIRQVEAAVNMIGIELAMTCASYTAATAPSRRRELLGSFAAGDLQVLVAIRCLDEGVDVPATRTAHLLASSTNPRQFVQRRGRVLRRFPGKTRADLHDFVMVPSPKDFPRDTGEYKMVRGLLRGQLGRSREFAELAENGPVALGTLRPYLDHFDLLTAI